MVDIIRDIAVEEKIFNVKANAEDLTQRIKRIHISDIMNPRDTVMKRKYSPHVTDKLFLTFLAGKGHHVLVQDILETKENQARIRRCSRQRGYPL